MRRARRDAIDPLQTLLDTLFAADHFFVPHALTGHVAGLHELIES